MQKKRNYGGQVAERKQPVLAPSVPVLLLLAGYVFIPALMPGFGALDANAVKFPALAVLNLLSAIFIATSAGHRRDGAILKRIIQSWPWAAYLLFLLISLLSVIKAVNPIESVVQIAKTWTIFAAGISVAWITRGDVRYLTFLVKLILISLLLDCAVVFYEIFRYIRGEVGSIYDIKFVYSNKNILGAALFVKTPAALWLLTFGRSNRERWVGGIVLFLGLLATLFLSTRAFYLGSAVLFISYGIYTAMAANRKEEGGSWSVPLRALTAIAAAVICFTVVQGWLYPASSGKDADIYNKSIASRVATIREGEVNRIASWGRTLKLIGEEPLLGVGAGNWKVAVLKYENPGLKDYTYMYKNHNDFLEITAETGLIGGMAFLAVFLLTGWLFVRRLRKEGRSGEGREAIFLAAFGLLAYSVDAFFNFPGDRPESGSLFALFLAVLPMAFFGDRVKKEIPFRYNVLLLAAIMVLMAGALWVLMLNLKSVRLQRLVKEDIVSGKLTMPADRVLAGFPPIPTISMEGEPIAVHKARYLLNESRYEEAFALLKNDRSSPWDTRAELFLAMAYGKTGQDDSSLVYSRKVLTLKPLEYSNVANLCRICEKRNDTAGAMELISVYLGKVKDNPQAWMLASTLLDRSGRTGQASTILDSALRYFPDDTLMLRQKSVLGLKLRVMPWEHIFNRGVALFRKQHYREAEQLFTSFLERVPGVADGHEYRAYCRYYLGDPSGSNADLEAVFAIGLRKSYLLNLRGVNYHLLGKDDLACPDFTEAARLGNPDGAVNLEKFCRHLRH